MEPLSKLTPQARRMRSRLSLPLPSLRCSRTLLPLLGNPSQHLPLHRHLHLPLSKPQHPLSRQVVRRGERLLSVRKRRRKTTLRAQACSVRQVASPGQVSTVLCLPQRQLLQRGRGGASPRQRQPLAFPLRQ